MRLTRHMGIIYYASTFYNIELIFLSQLLPGILPIKALSKPYQSPINALSKPYYKLVIYASNEPIFSVTWRTFLHPFNRITDLFYENENVEASHCSLFPLNFFWNI
jgi:hypothetical protein